MESGPGGRRRVPLPWVALALAVVLVVLLGTLDLPVGLPPLPPGPYLLYASLALVLVASRLVMELLGPLFRRIMASHTDLEADVEAVHQVAKYVVGFAVAGIVLYILLGGTNPVGQVGIGITAGILLYIMETPILNFAGWALIAVGRAYRIGDSVEVGGAKGYVTNVGILGTTLREFGGWMSGEEFTGRRITVPNQRVLEEPVYNYTKDTEFVWDELPVRVTYESDFALAEKYILDAAEEVVGEMMRSNRAVVRAKYEFADLSNYMVEEPDVDWILRPSWLEMSLCYFVPWHRREEIRTLLIKAVLTRFAADPRVASAYPHVESVPYKGSDDEVLGRTMDPGA